MFGEEQNSDASLLGDVLSGQTRKKIIPPLFSFCCYKLCLASLGEDTGRWKGVGCTAEESGLSVDSGSTQKRLF